MVHLIPPNTNLSIIRHKNRISASKNKLIRHVTFCWLLKFDATVWFRIVRVLWQRSHA